MINNINTCTWNMHLFKNIWIAFCGVALQRQIVSIGLREAELYLVEASGVSVKKPDPA